MWYSIPPTFGKYQSLIGVIFLFCFFPYLKYSEIKRSKKTKLPADARGNPKYRSIEIRPPSITPSPPGVSGRAPSRKDRIETVTIRLKGRLIFRAKATNLRRIISRVQTPQDRRITGIKDFLN